MNLYMSSQRNTWSRVLRNKNGANHEIIYKIMYELHNSELICKFINEFICKVENKHSYIMRSFVNHAWIYSMNLYINPLEFWQICLHKFIHKFMYVFHIWFFVWNFKSSPLACSQGPGRWGLADGLPHWQALHSKEYEIQGAALVARAARRMPGWQLEDDFKANLYQNSLFLYNNLGFRKKRAGQTKSLKSLTLPPKRRISKAPRHWFPPKRGAPKEGAPSLLRKEQHRERIIKITRQESGLCKYIKNKRPLEARITCLLQRHFPMSNIADNLAQDRSLTFGMFSGRKAS